MITGDSDDPQFFVLPDIGAQLAELDNMGLSDAERQERKDQITQEYAVKAERVHTIHQLLKAYALFEKDDEYVVIDNKVKIVDEQTGRIMEGRRLLRRPASSHRSKRTRKSRRPPPRHSPPSRYRTTSACTIS